MQLIPNNLLPVNYCHLKKCHLSLIPWRFSCRFQLSHVLFSAICMLCCKLSVFSQLSLYSDPAIYILCSAFCVLSTYPCFVQLSVCSAQLSVCSAQLSVCYAQLSVCYAQLSVCYVQLSVCSAQLSVFCLVCFFDQWILIIAKKFT